MASCIGVQRLGPETLFTKSQVHIHNISVYYHTCRVEQCLGIVPWTEMGKLGDDAMRAAIVCKLIGKPYRFGIMGTTRADKKGAGILRRKGVLSITVSVSRKRQNPYRPDKERVDSRRLSCFHHKQSRGKPVLLFDDPYVLQTPHHANICWQNPTPSFGISRS